MRIRVALLVSFPLSALLAVSSRTESVQPKVVFMPYVDARPILQAMAEALPPGLRGLTPQEQESAWPGWVKQQDAEIRARLKKGDEDSLLNFLLFGTSFTHQPRVTPELLGQMKNAPDAAPAASSTPAFVVLLDGRIRDLLAALAKPSTNERFSFARRVLKRNGYDATKDRDLTPAVRFLRARFAAMLKEDAEYAEAIKTARQLGNPTEQLAERSTLFRARGLSLDTSWRPDYAIEESLRALMARGLLAAASVHRVAIIGPGLDFTDKQEGYDFYPQQTIQPFAVIDSLVRLGLARSDASEVTTLDISSRVNEHLAHARALAMHGRGYTLQVPLDPATPWMPATAEYWSHFGDQVGTPAPASPVPPELQGLNVRGFKIRPSVVTKIHPVDLDIVLQRMIWPDVEARFDLIVATNILVYYDVFEQSLALSNIAAMLRPGGFLLSNNALLELPSSPIRSVGYQTTVYSSVPSDGDHIIWYQRR